MKSIVTQILSIQDLDQKARMYFNFSDKDLLLTFVNDAGQHEFTIEPQMLEIFAYAYKLHCEEYKEEEEKNRLEKEI